LGVSGLKDFTISYYITLQWLSVIKTILLLKNEFSKTTFYQQQKL